LAASVASGLAFTALDLPPDLLWLAIPVAVYSVAAYGDRWVSLAGLAVAEVGSVANQLTPGRFQAPTVVSNALFIAAAWLLGHFVGVRRLNVLQLEERTAELEQAREELARRAVTEERLRLARELHDVVAHAMSVIAVQSGVGAHVANTQPKEAAKALAAIEATSRAALEELRRLLGVLRHDNESQASLTPVPGLALSSPVVWGDRIFVTSVIPLVEQEKPRTGIYLDGRRVNPPPGEPDHHSAASAMLAGLSRTASPQPTRPSPWRNQT
jgi:signal transduction histidine kinase